MKYYRIADVVICINENGYDIEPHFKMEQFLFKEPEQAADYYFELKIVDEILLPVTSCDYYDDGRSFWMAEKRRSFSNLYGDYGCTYETSPNHFLIEINGSLKNFAHTDTQIFNMIGIERLMIEHGGIFLHSSLVSYRNHGIVFTAPSGTGKSTQAELWKQHAGAFVINGDKSVLKIKDDRWTAYGIPFSGSSEHCTPDECPLSAIIYLQQAGENRLTRIKGIKALQKLYSETTINVWDETIVNKTIGLLSDLVEKIPMYIFECTKEADAVEVLRRELFHKEA